MGLTIRLMNYIQSIARILGLISILLVSPALAQESSTAAGAPALTGSWGGPLVIGEDDLGLIFNFSMEDGEYAATMISDGLGIYGMPADRVSLRGLSLTVIIRRLDVEFTGTLRFDDAGEELLRIDASWFQGSEMVPVVLRPVE